MTTARARTKQKHPVRNSILMLSLVVASIGVIIWANLWKNDMRVTNISVYGNFILNTEEILSLVDITKDRRLFDVDLLAVQNRVMQNAFVKSVSVNREVPDKISIFVKERIPIAAVIFDQIKYIDTEGVILPHAHSENIFDLPALTGSLQSDKFVAGQTIADQDILEALRILSTAKQLSDDLYRRISEVHIEHGKDVVLYTSEYGVPVIFGHGDIGMKLVKLEVFWKEIVHHRGTSELAYIDLRFADQVVVRWNPSDERTHASASKSGKLQYTKTS